MNPRSFACQKWHHLCSILIIPFNHGDHMRFALVSLFTLISTSLFAQSGTGVTLKRVSEGQVVRLERCGGLAKLTRVQGDLTLQIRGANCSNLRTNLGGWKLNGDGNGQRWIDVRFDESTPGDKMVLIVSN
jgi:hypothetical protein